MFGCALLSLLLGRSISTDSKEAQVLREESTRGWLDSTEGMGWIMRDAQLVEDVVLKVSRDRKPDTLLLPRGLTVRETWRVVDTDNFGGDYPNEQLMAEGFPSEYDALLYADAANVKAGKHATRYFKVVKHIEITYSLQPGFEL
jgi:hypothetical protein